MNVATACSVLGVPEVTDEGVHDAFRRYALRNHPDRGGDAAEFALGVKARDVLQSASPPKAPAPVNDHEVTFVRSPSIPAALVQHFVCVGHSVAAAGSRVWRGGRRA